MADRYRITDPESGKTVTVTGDAPPTQEDAEQIFRDAGLRSEAATQSQDQYPELRKAVPGPVVQPQPAPDTLMGWGRRAIESLAPTPLLKPAEVAPAYVEGIKGHLEGRVANTLGLPGEAEALLRTVLPIPQLHMPGQQPATILPTSDYVADTMFGKATNPMQEGGRMTAPPLPIQNVVPYAQRMAEISGVNRAVEAGRNLVGTSRLPSDEVAQRLLQRSLARDRITPEQVTLTTARFPEKDVAVMDVGGPATARLARRVRTLGGEGGGAIDTFLAERQAGQQARVIDDINANLADGTHNYDTAKTMIAERNATSRPLRDQAFEGGSVAPLQTQFENAFNDASKQALDAQRQLSEAQAALDQAQHRTTLTDNVYAQSSAREDVRNAQAQVRQAQAASDAAEASKADILERLRASQADAANNAPGAVWSPRLQQFLDSPEVRRGIRHGLMVQRREALAEGRPFNPTEYGITGADANGEPIIARVPNMRLLDAGKIGIDAMLEEYRQPNGTLRLDEAGRALNEVRKAYVAELDRLNPRYAAARAAYSGPSQSLDAMNLGKNFTRYQPGQIRDHLARLSEGDRDFYRVGAAGALQDRVLKAGDNADAVARVFGNKNLRNQLEAIFGKARTDQFAEAMTGEKLARETNRFVRGGSQTADKAIDLTEGDAELIGDIAHVAHSTARGGLTAGAVRAGAILGNRFLGRLQGISPEVNTQLGQLLMQTGDRPLNILPRGNLPPLAVNNRARAVPPIIAAGAIGGLASRKLGDDAKHKRQ